MKEVTTVELDREDLGDAIYQYLYEKGYVTSKVEFVYEINRFTGNTIVAGAKVVVEHKK